MQADIHRVHLPTRRERFAHFRRQYAAFFVAGLTGVALLAGAMTFGMGPLEAMWRDTAGSPLYSGQATVVQIFRGRGLNLFGTYTVELNFRGQTVFTGTPLLLFPGQHVTLHYRVGRSGFLYPVNASP